MTKEEFIKKISGITYISVEQAGKLYDEVVSESIAQEKENNEMGPYENSFERNEKHQESTEIIKRSLGLKK